MKENIFNLDVSVCNWWLLIVHLQQAPANIFHNMYNLLFTETFASKLHDEVEQIAIGAQLADYTNLMHTWAGLLNLCFIYGDDIFVIADLSPYLHLISYQLSLFLRLRIDLLQGIFWTSSCISD